MFESAAQGPAMARQREGHALHGSESDVADVSARRQLYREARHRRSLVSRLYPVASPSPTRKGRDLLYRSPRRTEPLIRKRELLSRSGIVTRAALIARLLLLRWWRLLLL
jgi:hypothetical protein